jgi:flagellar protein FlbT
LHAKGFGPVPLKIDLKPGDKIIVNGAVLENAGGNAKILIHNEAAILRSKEIMTEKERTSPAAHIYFTLQCAYVFPDKVNEYMEQFTKLAEDFMIASPSSAAIISEIARLVDEGMMYKALKMSQKLLAHEKVLMNAARAELTPGPMSTELPPDGGSNDDAPPRQLAKPSLSGKTPKST